jgi:hypothetical protein
MGHAYLTGDWLLPLLFPHLHRMDYTKVTVAAVAIPVAWLLFKKLRRSDIADIRGPDTSWSFLLGMTKSRLWTLPRRSDRPVGHLKLLWQSDCGTMEEMFLDNYGSVVRIKTPFTVRQNRMSQFPSSLLVFTGIRRTDFGLRTLQPCTTSTKPQVTSTKNLRTVGRWKQSSLTKGCYPQKVRTMFRIGIVFQLILLLGAAHRRQRKAMMPAFGLTASRELLPRFTEVVDKASRVYTSGLDLH